MWTGKRNSTSTTENSGVVNSQDNESTVGQLSEPSQQPSQKQNERKGSPQPDVPSISDLARIGPGLRVKGEISGNEDFVIDGAVEGTVRLGQGKLTLGTSGKVTADVTASEVVVSGQLKGNVTASKRVEITKNGALTGDVMTAQIVIEDGAYFKGSIEIERNSEARAAKASGSPGGIDRLPRPQSQTSFRKKVHQEAN